MRIKKYLSIVFIFSLLLPISLNANPSVQSEISKPSIEAGAVLLMDAKTHTVLYEKNGYSKQYPASITKLMTALLSIETLQTDDKLTFSYEAVNTIEPGSSHIGIMEDEVLTVDEALHGLLLMSANEVANGLAEAVSGSIDAFANKMTLRAKELGAQNTNFVNPHGLHDDKHYTTPYDMALIGSALSDNDYFLKIMKDATYEIPLTNKSDEIRYLYQQHKMVSPYRDASLYRETVIGGKTGYTDQARHTLVTIEKRENTTLVAVVMQSEKNTIYTDTQALLDYGFDSFSSLTLHTVGETIKTLPIYSIKSGQLYQRASAAISIKEEKPILIDASIDPTKIISNVQLPEYLEENVQEGDEVGKLSYLHDSKILGEVNLVVTKLTNEPLPVFPEEPEITEVANDFMTLYSWFYILAGLLFLLLAFILISFLFKRKQYHRNRLKMKKLFK